MTLYGFIGDRENIQRLEHCDLREPYLAWHHLPGGVIEYHLNTWKAREPHVVAE